MDRNTQPHWSYLFLLVRTYDLFSLFFPSRLSPLVTYRMESPALGAQWEFVSRIPSSVPVTNQVIANSCIKREKIHF